MLAKYVWVDLIRNPRRTLSTVVGVMLGVGLSCAVLFFVDALAVSMTQQAVAPLPLDMQLVLTDPLAGDVRLAMEVEPTGAATPGDIIQVRLTLRNRGEVPANEVIVRSVLAAGLTYRAGSTVINGKAVADEGESPFANGPAKAGLNLGAVAPGASVRLEYQASVTKALDISEESFDSTVSAREALTPQKANAREPISLAELALRIKPLDGIATAEQLSFVDLARGALAADAPVDGLVRLFGFDASYVAQDKTIKIVEGAQVAGEALISAEAAEFLAVNVNDVISLELPDGTRLDQKISGIVDLSQARSLFSSRQGAHLETFMYLPYAVVIDSATFSAVVIPAFKRAVADRGERVKSIPIREVDIHIHRELLDAEPVLALAQTQRIAKMISAVTSEQNFLLDNISNTLAVARDDAVVAKQMFVFLGVPGAMLAAMLGAFAGIVLAGAQRREQATLRIRGASRQHLLWMLALRVSCITVAGAAVGVTLGYASVAAVVGHSTLMRATTGSLVTSALLGTVAGLIATGAALYSTGRWSIDREINEERFQLLMRPPAWQRYRLDLVGIAVVLVATVVVIWNSGFEGIPGSVYVGRSVQLPLGLLVLPLGAWVAGSLFGGRIFAWLLARPWKRTSQAFIRPLSLLYWMSLKRRTWSLVDATVILGMIVTLATSLAVFTASYNGAKAADARYIIGSDLKIIPSPARKQPYVSADAAKFAIEGIDVVVPVVHGVHNAVLYTHRTSEVANLAALDPMAYAQVAPFDDAHFSTGSANKSLSLLANRPDGILLSAHMADFIQAQVGGVIRVLLARGTAEQVMVEMEVLGTFERLPGFPDGADALINLEQHQAMVASTVPAFFLGQTSDRSDAALPAVVTKLRNGPGAEGDLQLDTRLTALAKDQSSLAALNMNGLLKIDSGYALAMGTVTVAIFVFGLLLQRRREYVTLRAQGMAPKAIRAFIAAEAGTTTLAGCAVGVPLGIVMAFYLINVLRALFVLDPGYVVPMASLGIILGSLLAATVVTSLAASTLVNQLQATELLRDE